MAKQQRLHFVDFAGLVIATLLIVGGMLSVLDPRVMLIFHATNDFVGTPAGLLEKASVDTVRFYGWIAVLSGALLAIYVVWSFRKE